jgi:Bacterial Ig-like domain (group 3)
VSIARCFPGISRRQSLFVIFLAALSVGLASSTDAQTAPQLLPYTAKLIAGSGTAAIAAGATCPVSGLKSTDAVGDGCLATEVNLGNASAGGPRFAVADRNGNIFIGDFVNGRVRRVDVITGVISTVAGGAASSPASGTVCGTGTSISGDGDGCPANLVKLSKPAALVFAPNGDLYFSDNGFDNVRKIAATGGLITSTGTITHIVGGSTFGYNVNNTSTSGPVNATQAPLNFPYGLALDAAGNNLYIADEGNNAIEVVNLTSASETIQGLTVPAGTIAKFSGYGNLGATAATSSATSGDCPDFTAAVSGQRGGCYFGKWVDGAVANTSNNDGVYSLAVDASNNVYFGNEFNNNIGFISAANIISNYAGIQGTALKDITKRGPAKSFGIGSVFGIALDSLNNLYITDASSGVIWRVDGAGKSMYLIGGGAATVCSAATDVLGDGCPARQAIFGRSGTGNFASATLPGPGIYGISVDASADLFFGDTENPLIREMASGTQFGNVGAVQTDTLDVHFAAGDSAATGGYKITVGGSIFSLGTPSCTTNSDLTTDCLLPVTATPSVLGPFTGTLQVQSQLGGTSTFALSGNFIQSPVTRTVVSASTPTACSGSATIATTAPATLSATLTANGPSAPTGNIIFFANGTAIAPAAGVPVTNIGTASVPMYGANLTTTFATAGTYAITATYSGDSYFKTSTSASSASVTTAVPAYTTSLIAAQQNTVSAGQTALYSFNIAQTVYTGTITFAATGLPANSSIVFSPSTITATGCSTTSTVAVSILTQPGTTSLSAIGLGGRGVLGGLTTLLGMGLALAIGLRRRGAPLRYGQFWMALALLLAASGTIACGKGVTSAPRTPAGTYSISITATGSNGATSSLSIPLTVN